MNAVTPGSLSYVDSSALVQNLVEVVQQRLQGRIRNLQLSLHQEGLLLRGQTNCYHAKQLAQTAIMAASTLPILANDIEVV